MELKPYTATLKWEDEDAAYPGLEVVLNLNASIDLFFATISGSGPEFIANMTRFADEALVSWNVKREGEAVPADGVGLLSLPFHLVSFIVGQWRNAAVNPPAPLSGRSPNGSTSATRSGKTEAA